MMSNMQPQHLPKFPPEGGVRAYAFGPYFLNVPERRLLRAGVTVAASPKVIETLIFLVERSGELVSKSELLDAIWPEVFVEEGNLAQNISQLRRIFRDDFPAPGIILTVPKRGYSFTAKVHPQELRPTRLQEAPEPELDIDATVDLGGEPGVRPILAGQVAPTPHRSGFLLRYLKRFPLRPISLLPIVGLPLFLCVILLARSGQGVYAARPLVAILTFQNLSGTPDTVWFSSALTENLQSDLASSESLRLVPGEVVSRAQRELALPPTASFSKASLERIHRDLDCDLVVVGSYLVAGGSIRLNLSVEETTTGRIIGTYSHAEAEGQTLALIAGAGAALRQILHVRETAQQDASDSTAPSEANPDFLKLYYEGLRQLRLGAAEPARELLQQSIALSPKAPLAHLAMSQVWSLEGYDLRAADEARKAADLSKQLPREDQLRIQARFFETQPNWRKAVETYQALRLFFPDNREYSYQLASALTSAGKPVEALQELNALCPSIAGSPGCDPREMLLKTSALNAQALWPQALSVAQQAASAAKSRGALILYENALADEATALGKLGQTEKEDSTILEAISVANETNDRFGSMTLLLHRASSLRRARNLAAALEVAQQALDISKSMGARQQTVDALVVLGSTYRDSNDLPRAHEAFQQAFALAQELESPRRAIVELNLANVENNLGQPQKARLLYQDALTLAEAAGDRGTQNILHGNLGILDEAEGEPEAALTMLRLAIAGNQAISQKASIAYDLGHMANVLLMEGDFAGTHRALDDQAALLPALGHGRGPQEQRELRGELALEEGHVEDALALFTSALDSCSEPASCSHADLLLAWLWLRRGDPTRALPFAVKSYELTHTLTNPADYILPSMLQLAEVDAALGRTEQARELFSTAARQSHQLELLPLELKARRGKAALQQKDSPVQAQSELREIEREARAHKLLLIARDTAELLPR